MPSRLKTLIAGALCCAVLASGRGSAGAATEPSGWSYRAWETDEGLPDNSVTSVAQTADGYMWVATYGGLLRFNGASFTPIPLPVLLKKSVRTMLLDHRGRLWVGMVSGSVICLDPAGARTFSSADGLPVNRVAAMTEDRAGAIWVAYSTALCRIKDDQVSRFTGTEGWPAGVNAWVASDAGGEVWFSKGGHVGMVRAGKLLAKLSFEDSSVRLCGSASSGMWICVGSRVLWYDGDHPPEERAQLPPKAEPLGLLEDRVGALWIGTMSDGLFHFQAGALEKVPTSHQSVYNLYEDREGNILASIRGGGLNLIRPSAISFIDRKSGLPFESVASVCEDSETNIWAVSPNGILAKYRAGTWEVIGTGSGWKGEYATCVAADRKGGVWVGSRNLGLYYFHDGIWQTWAKWEGLPFGIVHLIFVDSRDHVWVVTGSPSQLQQLQDGKITLTLELPEPSQTIRAMAEGADGTLWVGTLEGQILRLKGASLTVETAAAKPSGEGVRALETGTDGALWIGYAGGGLGRLKDGKFSQITTAAGLVDDFDSQLLADHRGGLWVVGNHGLFRVQEEELAAVAGGQAGRLRAQAFGRSEGLPNFQPSSASFPNVCRAADGRLWFALRSGLLMVQPEMVRDNPTPPPVLVERVSVDDRTVALYDSGTPLQTETGTNCPDLHPPHPVLQIPPGHRKLEFDFAALSFTSPENVRFRYQLDNFDGQWIEAGRQTNAIYPRLPAGGYRFHVLACNNAGVWNKTGATLAFEVTPFFWQRWWFRALVILSFTGCVVAIVRYVSFRRLRAQMAKLEQQAALEKERSRIARDMHDEVGAKLTRLSLLNDMAGDRPEAPPATRSDLKEISDTARETIRSFEEIVWAVNPRNDTLAVLVHYLCRYAEDFFDGSPVQCSFDLPPKIPPYVLPTELRHHVFLAAKEALSNALKYAGAKNVWIKLVLGAGEFKIYIEDDGCGFDPVAPPKRTGGGNGLENMRERLRSVGGLMECHSRSGKGTRIVFTAPVKDLLAAKK